MGGYMEKYNLKLCYIVQFEKCIKNDFNFDYYSINKETLLSPCLIINNRAYPLDNNDIYEFIELDENGKLTSIPELNKKYVIRQFEYGNLYVGDKLIYRAVNLKKITNKCIEKYDNWKNVIPFTKKKIKKY